MGQFSSGFRGRGRCGLYCTILRYPFLADLISEGAFLLRERAPKKRDFLVETFQVLKTPSFKNLPAALKISSKLGAYNGL